MSHVGLAARENNDGIMIRRRSYNYTDGLDANGQLNAGLLFVSYQKIPKILSVCRTDWVPTTFSTNTSATSGQQSSRCRRRRPKAITSRKACSAEQISPIGSGRSVALCFRRVMFRVGTVNPSRPPSRIDARRALTP